MIAINSFTNEIMRNSLWMLLISVVSVYTSCPEMDIDYYGYDFKHISSIPTWEHCNEQCKFHTGCAAWSWVSMSAEELPHYTCMLKNIGYASGRKPLIGFISGSLSSCKDCVPTTGPKAGEKCVFPFTKGGKNMCCSHML